MPEWTPEEVAALRKRLNLSIRAFADTLGVNKDSVTNWEQGHKAPGALAKRQLDRLRRR